jgi:hypothetical protein
MKTVIATLVIALSVSACAPVVDDADIAPSPPIAATTTTVAELAATTTAAPPVTTTTALSDDEFLDMARVTVYRSNAAAGWPDQSDANILAASDRVCRLYRSGGFDNLVNAEATMDGFYFDDPFVADVFDYDTSAEIMGSLAGVGECGDDLVAHWEAMGW